MIGHKFINDKLTVFQKYGDLKFIMDDFYPVITIFYHSLPIFININVRITQ